MTMRPAARGPVIVGITGPIGCGKSTVAGWLAELPGVVTIDADRVARDVLAPGTPETERVYERFGAGLRRADGSLDRAALGRIVFADPVALRDLEAIVHPGVRPRILTAIDQATMTGARAVIVEAIKLVEGGLADRCDEVWLVTCDPSVQLARIVGRGDGEAAARERVAAQAGMTARLTPAAARVFITDDVPATTRRAVEGALADLLADEPRDQSDNRRT
jgi:dephospho-CoA kinase